MHLRIATWNINSVRLRIDQVARFVDEAAIDVLCLQEIKCHDGEFPVGAFEAMGMPHLAIRGQKGWHGVAIASRHPIMPAPVLDLCREGHAKASAPSSPAWRSRPSTSPPVATSRTAPPTPSSTTSSTSSPAWRTRWAGATRRRPCC